MMTRYQLEFYDSYDREMKVAPGNSMFDLLERWSLWLDSNFWIIYKGRYEDGEFYRDCVVGRSALYNKKVRSR